MRFLLALVLTGCWPGTLGQLFNPSQPIATPTPPSYSRLASTLVKAP